MSIHTLVESLPTSLYPFIGDVVKTCPLCHGPLGRTVNRLGICMNCAHPHNRRGGVGVNIEEQPTLFQQATKTIGIDREIGLLSADVQLMSDAVMDAKAPNCIKTNDIAKGTYGRVLERYIKPNGTSKLTSLIKTANASLPQKSSRFAYATKIMVPMHDTMLETSTINEFVLRNLNDPGVVKIGAVSFRYDNVNPTAVSTYMSMDRAKMSGQDLFLSAIAERKQYSIDNNVSEYKLPLFASNEYKMLAYQLIRSVAYLHSELIIHGDIKIANILVSATKNVPAECLDFVMAGRDAKQIRTFKVTQLTDFGLCRPNYTNPIPCPHPNIYTINYRPPEFIFGAKGYFCSEKDAAKGDQYVTPKSDIWAMGCVLYALATGCDFMTITPTKETNSIKTNTEIAQQLYTLYPFTDFTRHPTMFPGYRSDIMNAACQKLNIARMNPWANDSLAKYPGLHELLRRMLVINPYDRVDMSTLLQSPFFTYHNNNGRICNIGELFNKAMHVDVDPIAHIVYNPNSYDVTESYIQSHMLKNLPSKHKQHNSPDLYNPDVYRRLVTELLIWLPQIVANRMPTYVGDFGRVFESKVMALMRVWTLKNAGMTVITEPRLCTTMVFVFILIALKTCNVSEETALFSLGEATKSQQDILTQTEYGIVEQLDFDVWISAPYEYCLRFLKNVTDTYPDQDTPQMQTAFNNAKNFLRILHFDPLVVHKVESIQIIDSALDICVRSRVAERDLYKYKSLDPHYSRLEYINANDWITQMMNSETTIGMSNDDTSKIINDIIIYSQTGGVY